MRAYVATFAGAFFIALLYSTKPDSDHEAILHREATAAPDSLRAGVTAAPDSFFYDSAVGLEPPAPDTPAALPASASDIDALRAQSPVVPVAGIEAGDLLDSFDDRRGSARQHNALDIMAPRNTPAIAAVAGTIVKLHSSVAGGLSIYMKDRTSRFMLMYGHLEGYRPGLAEGASVRKGEIIGFVGSSGNANPTAPHLHFQLMRSDNDTEWWKGTPINPFLIYQAAR
ncbi:MAG: M23 family metallopeptidase [Gemmatimonadaceae bacterium]